MSDAYTHAISDESERLRLEIGHLDMRAGEIATEIQELWQKADRAIDKGRIAEARRLSGRIPGKMEEQNALVSVSNALSALYVAEKWRVLLEPLDRPPPPQGASAGPQTDTAV